MCYNNLEEKEVTKKRVAHCQMSFPYIQPLWIKQPDGFFDPIYQISSSFVQMDPQLLRCAFCLNIFPLNPLVSSFC